MSIKCKILHFGGDTGPIYVWNERWIVMMWLAISRQCYSSTRCTLLLPSGWFTGAVSHISAPGKVSNKNLMKQRLPLARQGWRFYLLALSVVEGFVCSVSLSVKCWACPLGTELVISITNHCLTTSCKSDYTFGMSSVHMEQKREVERGAEAPDVRNGCPSSANSSCIVHLAVSLNIWCIEY